MTFKNRYAARVEWADCDPLGQIFYPNFFRWFDIGTHKLLEAAGETYTEVVDKRGIAGLPLVDAQASFRERCLWTDDVEIESYISEWGRKSFTVTHLILNGGKVAVEGKEIRVWGLPHPEDPDRLMTGEIPEDFKAMFERDGGA